MANKKKKEKVRIRLINPLRADVYGENHRRNQTVIIDADIAEKAIENKDAVRV